MRHSDEIPAGSFLELEKICKETKIEFPAKDFHSEKHNVVSGQENQVLVIMRFEDKILDSAYHEVIRPLFIEYGITVIGVDELEDTNDIGAQIADQIARSRFIYVDLTGEESGSYYDSGVAHSLGKEMILTINETDKEHSKLSTDSIRWGSEAELRALLRQRLTYLLVES